MRPIYLLCAFFFTGCGLDPLLFSLTDEAPLPALPEVQPNILSGFVDALPEATVSLSGASGQSVQGETTLDGDARYAFTLPGETAFNGLRVIAQSGSQMYWGLAPAIPAQSTVLDGTRTIPMALLPGMERLNSASTTAALLLLKRSGGIPLSGEGLEEALTEVFGQFSGDTAVSALHQMILRLDEAASNATADSPSLYLSDWTGKAGTSPLNPAFLLDGVDYGGTGVLETTTTLFDETLEAAASSIELDTCTVSGWTRVIFTVRLQEGLLDGNCSPLNPYLWASEGTGKSVFFTGGIHVDTPFCSEGTSEECLNEDLADSLHLELGAWEPNVVPMFDDGTNGDAVKGDGIWTRSFILPVLSGERSVRIGYKYTFGNPGALWTNTEEWPGNQRILEVLDLDGDGLVIRLDSFGDEATNKDKKNALSFANGGCGTNKWPEDAGENCHSDVFENFPVYDEPCGNEDTTPYPALAPVTCGEAALLEN